MLENLVNNKHNGDSLRSYQFFAVISDNNIFIAYKSAHRENNII
jgi:hypothetical protein